VPRERKDIDAALRRKGFLHDDGDHHYYIYRNLAGRKTIRKTMMSRGSSHKTVSDSILSQMARQVGLTKPKFLELVDCSLDQPSYERLAFPPKS
jgi:predicted transcriptional regulator